MKPALTLIAALLLAPLAALHGAPTGNDANPGTKAECSPLPAKKQGSRSSQSPSHTQVYGDFSLNKIWFVLEKYQPPTGEFDPAEDAPAHFTLFTLGSRRPCGCLTLRRANGPGDTVTLTHAWGLFDAVQRLPREKTEPVSFSLIEEGDILKERQNPPDSRIRLKSSLIAFWEKS